MQYYRRHYEDSIFDDLNADWGKSFYYFETDDNLNVERQMQVFENGFVLKYDLEYLEDKHGGLSEVPLDETFNVFQVDKVDFIQLWNMPTFPSRYPEIVITEDILWGQPRLDGRRLAVGDIVSHVYVNKSAIEAANDYEISLQQTRQALQYCRTLQCLKDKPLVFCHNCSLRVQQDGEGDGEECSNWIRADMLINIYFPMHKNSRDGSSSY